MILHSWIEEHLEILNALDIIVEIQNKILTAGRKYLENIIRKIGIYFRKTVLHGSSLLKLLFLYQWC